MVDLKKTVAFCRSKLKLEKNNSAMAQNWNKSVMSVFRNAEVLKAIEYQGTCMSRKTRWYLNVLSDALSRMEPKKLILTKSMILDAINATSGSFQNADLAGLAQAQIFVLSLAAKIAC